MTLDRSTVIRCLMEFADEVDGLGWDTVARYGPHPPRLYVLRAGVTEEGMAVTVAPPAPGDDRAPYFVTLEHRPLGRVDDPRTAADEAVRLLRFGGTATPLRATQARAPRDLQQRLGVKIWYGDSTRTWWALVGGRLVEADDPERLEEAVVARLADVP